MWNFCLEIITGREYILYQKVHFVLCKCKCSKLLPWPRTVTIFPIRFIYLVSQWHVNPTRIYSSEPSLTFVSCFFSKTVLCIAAANVIIFVCLVGGNLNHVFIFSWISSLLVFRRIAHWHSFYLLFYFAQLFSHLSLYCCNLSGGVALIMWFTTNGMCVKNKTIIYVARASNSKRDCKHDLYCCLLPQCEALCTCRSGFPIATVLPPNFMLLSISLSSSTNAKAISENLNKR